MDRGQWVRSKAEGKILEVGSAGGHLFRDTGLDVHYVDINEYPLPNFTVADAHNLPFPDDSFTTVSVCELLEHVRDPLQVLKEAARVSSRKVIFTIPFEYLWTADKLPFMSVEDRMKQDGLSREGEYRQGNPTVTRINSVDEAFHTRWFTRASLEDLLKQLGLPYSIELLDYDGWAFLVGEIKAAAPSENVFDNPEYWCGEIGYRPDSSTGIGYSDFPIHAVKVNYILSKKPGKVLDIGCAFGYIVQRLRRKGVEAWGIDISHYALAHAPEEVKPYLVHGSADALPWPDQFFDMVISFATLEHLPPDILPKAISEIKRVSKRGIITVGPEKPGFDDDITHRIKEPLSWWRSQFPPEFEVRDEANEEWSEGVASLKIALLSTPFITVPPRNYGGLERIVADLAYALVKDGLEVTIFAPDDSYVEGCKMACFGPALEKVQVDWLEAEADATSMVASSLANDGYDIIHGHNWFGLEYALKAQKPELKVCHTHHGGLNMDYWGRSKPPWPLNLISLSSWMQRVYASQGFSSRPVYNGIPLEEYQFKAEKGARLLFVGRLDSFKRPHIAIEVAKKASLGLDIVGGSFVHDTAYMDSIKGACDGQQITLHLDAPHEVKIEFYQNAKAVIFPSKMGEPFGLIVPEAGACGTPVIASRDGAIPETIDEGGTGFICDTVDEMVEAVGKVDQIKPEACRERVEKLFSREVMAKNYVEAYRKILSEGEW